MLWSYILGYVQIFMRKLYYTWPLVLFKTIFNNFEKKKISVVTGNAMICDCLCICRRSKIVLSNK